MSEAGRFDRRMSDSDALTWRIEKDPLLRQTITSVAIFDRAPDRERLRERIGRASHSIVRLRQRAVPPPFELAPPAWVVDPNFDLDYHLRWMRAPGEGSTRELFDLVAPMVMQAFDRARPLWEFTVVEGLADGRAAFVQKVHHAVTDGVGGVELALLLLDAERSPAAAPDAPEAPPEPEDPSPVQMLVEGLGHEQRRALGIARRTAPAALRALRSPARSARAFAEGAGSARRILTPVFTPASPLMTGRSLRVHLDALSVPLPGMKAAARTVGGRLNDAFMAALLGGFMRYHRRHGAPVEELRTTMPINLRRPGDEVLGGNQFVPARFAVPAGIEDPAERMVAVRDLVADQRAEPALGFFEPLAGALNRLPTSALTRLFGGMLKGIDFVASNVPGAPFPVYLAGARQEEQYAFGPIAGSAANLTLLSYVDCAHVGVSTDPAAVPDPEALLGCLHEGFAEVLGLAQRG